MLDSTASPFENVVQAVPTGTRELYRQVWRYAKGMRGRYVVALTLLAGSQVVKLAVPYLVARAIDSIQQGGVDRIGHAGLIVAAILLVYIASWSMHGPGRILERNVGLHVRGAVADAMYAHLSNLPLAWHDVYHSGEVQHRAQQAALALQNFAQTQFVYLQNFVNIVGPLIALYVLAPKMGLLAMLGYVGIALVIINYDRRLMKLAVVENQLERRYTARLLDFLGNVGTVLSLRLQAVSRRLLAERLSKVFVPQRVAIKYTEAKWCAVDLLTIGLSWSLVALYAWLSQRSASSGSPLLLGSVFMVYQYANQAGSVIGAMAANLQGFARSRTDFASADPIFEAAEREPPEAIERDWRRIEARGLQLVYIRSDGARGGVQDVSVTLRRGERIALIGPSGGGKSTLLRLFAGLYEPQQGYYAIDGEARHSVASLASIATLIPQEAEVFEGTVKDNLTFGETYPKEEIERACRLSAFDAVVDALPFALETQISERGFNLSGGQRQRLALARGLLAARDSSLLLLDEPTSALDQLTEATIFGRLREALPDATLIASVHRMNALPHFDRILLMAEGHVLDFGTVEEVLRRQPLLREMVEAASAKLLRAQAEAEASQLGS